jgi:NADPH:quinone reductase-like Zn-dependent oxidoreductase
VRCRLSTFFPLLTLLAVSPLADAKEEPACATPPATMRAARIHAAGGPDTLRIEPVPVPAPAAGEVLVRVHFASINPVDWKLQEAGRLKFPAIPGGDFSGEIIATGAGVTGFKCGDLVAGIVNQRERGGSYAEYLTVPVTEIVPKPGAFSMAEAAAYPTVAVAAWRYLIDAAAVKSGDRVLVHGGAGGAGSMVVQLAKARGAYVIATASARNHEYLRTIGADETIDYRSVRFEEVVRNVDIVLDTVGGETLARSESVLRDGGRLVSMAGVVPPATCAAGRIVCPATPPWNVKEALGGVAPLIESGAIRINIDGTYALDAIVEAQQHNRNGSTRGKVVVDMGVATRTADVRAPAADIQGVTLPLQAYLDGHATGQEHHFRRAFAPDAMLVGIKDGKYGQRPASDYIKQSSSGRAPRDEAQRRRWIRSIVVTGDVATAVIELDYPDMKALDHMSLLKFGDGWRIVVKAYDAYTPSS